MKKLLTVLCCFIVLQVTAQQHIGDVHLKTFPPRVIDDMADRGMFWINDTAGAMHLIYNYQTGKIESTVIYQDTLIINSNSIKYIRIGNDVYKIDRSSGIRRLACPEDLHLADTIINGHHILLTPIGKQLIGNGRADMQYNKQINE